MALFMDSHAIDGGVKASDVAQAHLADLRTQDRYGVRYLRYWVDERAGRIFCLNPSTNQTTEFAYAGIVTDVRAALS
jgi:hypothetical protein